MRQLVVVLLLLSAASAFAAEVPDFEKEVLPLLKAKCTKCHGDRSTGGRLDIRTKEAMLKGGASGPAIVPGKAEKSLLVELVFYNEMPPKREKNRMTQEELQLLKAWIDGGAPVKK